MNLKHSFEIKLEAFREVLKKQSWDRVYTDNVNIAYEAFKTTLINLYDENF